MDKINLLNLVLVNLILKGRVWLLRMQPTLPVIHPSKLASFTERKKERKEGRKYNGKRVNAKLEACSARVVIKAGAVVGRNIRNRKGVKHSKDHVFLIPRIFPLYIIVFKTPRKRMDAAWSPRGLPDSPLLLFSALGSGRRGSPHIIINLTDGKTSSSPAPFLPFPRAWFFPQFIHLV